MLYLLCLFSNIQHVSVYTDYKQDESYTPSKISVRVGSHYHDLTVRCEGGREEEWEGARRE